MPSFRFFVLGFLFVSFRPSLIRSHSCSSGADLVLSLSVFSASDPLALARFSSASGYSALLFFRSLLPGLASQGAPSVPQLCLSASPLSAFSPARFPVLPFRLLVLGALFVSFHPTRLRSHSCSTSACLLPVPCVPFLSAFSLPIRSLSLASHPVLTTQPLCFLSLSSCLRLTVASAVLRSRFRSFGSPRSLRPGFPCLPSRFRYSALLFVSFRPSLIRSHSRSSGASLLVRFLSSASFRALSVPPRFLSSAFGFPSQLLSFLALPFRFFPHSPRASSFGAPSLLSSRRSPLSSALVSHGFCPIPLTRFSASFSFILPGSSPAADFPELALLSASSRPLLP